MNPLQFYRWLVVLNGAVPLLMLVWDAYHGHLGANSVNNALHVTGILSLVFLFLSLAVTPLKWLTGWGGLIALRRALGLYGFFYSLVHVVIYVGFDRALNFSSTWHEILMRRFLQVGTAAVLLMVPLAVTSTNTMIQRIGPKRWKQLHRAAYVVAALGVIHYYMLVKSDVRQPLAFGAILVVLLGARFGRHYSELLRASRVKPNLPGRQVTNATAIASPVTLPAVEKARSRWSGELRLAAIFQETHDVKTFRLQTPDGAELPFAYLPGQFLNLQLEIDGKRVNRSYTLASSPTRNHTCELSVKRDPNGLASRYLHDHLKVGELLKVSGPSGKFTFTGHDASSVLLIAGGVGITPAMSIVRYLTDRVWSGDIYFLIVDKTESDQIFRDEIQSLESRFPRLRVCRTLTRCAPEDTWTGDRGRITESLLRRFVPDLSTIPIYLCGPNEMMDATQTLLRNMGLPDSQIKTEAFGARKGKTATNEETSEPMVIKPVPTKQLPHSKSAVTKIESTTIHFSKTMVRTEISTETTVLEAAEASQIDVPYECRSGICGQCKTRLTEGTVIMDCEDALTKSEKAAGWILACQAHPRSNLVVDV